MYPVRVMCRVLEVSSSGYYAWRKRAPSERSKANAVLLKKIEQFHKESDGTYGAPRIHADLEAEKNGELTIRPTNVIVNAPVVRWPTDYLGGQSKIENQ